MKFLDESRDTRSAGVLLGQVHAAATRDWSLLEACGGQMHHLMRLGLDRALPRGLGLVHGPGCAVGLTRPETIDRALGLAARPGLTVCTTGDLLRVPGAGGTLQGAKAQGADVRAVYSPLDALGLARRCPERRVVYLAVGFEAVAPAAAAAVQEAARLGLTNFMLGGPLRLAPAVDAILGRGGPGRPAAVLVPGHLCSILGAREFEALAERHRVPVVVTGLAPLDLLEAILRAVGRLESGAWGVENLYPRGAHEGGNPTARAAVEAVFEAGDASWPGLGRVAGSAWSLRPAFAAFGVEGPVAPAAAEFDPFAEGCHAGEVLTGRLKPTACPAFGNACTPDHPLGAPMVSPEGTCAAYYRYKLGPAPLTAHVPAPSPSFLATRSLPVL